MPEPELTTSTPSSHPGARLPHVWLEDGSSLFDRLGTGFGLLRLTEQAGTTELTTAAADLGVPLDVVGLSREPGLRDRYRAELLPVRPDQHVAWRGTSITDAAGLLTRVTGGAAVAAGARRR